MIFYSRIRIPSIHVKDTEERNTCVIEVANCNNYVFPFRENINKKINNLEKLSIDFLIELYKL